MALVSLREPFSLTNYGKLVLGPMSTAKPHSGRVSPETPRYFHIAQTSLPTYFNHIFILEFLIASHKMKTFYSLFPMNYEVYRDKKAYIYILVGVC